MNALGLPAAPPESHNYVEILLYLTKLTHILCSTPIYFSYIKNDILSSLQSSKIDIPERYTVLPMALSTRYGTLSVGWVVEPYFKCVDFLLRVIIVMLLISQKTIVGSSW